MQHGTVLAGFFLLLVLATALLATLAVLENFPGGKGRKLFYRWRTPSSKLDEFLSKNAAVNEVLSVVATVALLVWMLVSTATEGLNRFLTWSQLSVLGARAALLLVYLYVLFGVVKILSELATEEAHPLLRRGLIRVIELVRPPPVEDPDDVAMLKYSYRNT